MVQNDEILFDIPLRDLNSWRVGGVVDQFYFCTDKEKLSYNLQKRNFKLPIMFIGLGSNTLFRDGGFRGTIIAMHKGLNHIKLEDQLFYAESGVSCSKLAKYIARLGYANSAFLAGIPGTLGGALAMNAGCYGSETWDFVDKVLTIDQNGIEHLRKKEEFDIAYRHVENKKNPQEFFIAAWLEFQEGNKEKAELDIKKLLEKRKSTQPLNWPTAGSTFRNPDGHFAAKLIEESGLKGYQIGGAQVSEKHANFIINRGNASASDIENLITYIKAEVFKQTKIILETEIRIIGEKN
ncbi:MAG: UDP-N-acetylmuramate dehydrogenase [Methylophilaceae bacterium]|nr:UDP-N-acetylmuramate dehydrogenase [Methylophilaceae bacterium]MBL6726502.1 UDP-N-acetylmuramate dehydrogenase [Methylophilaceae bacterium]MBL6728214.1 UDP-N-acetylmuramate dehydrogenase [Methylophilaceae bacterium]MBL6790954.1 UDP-N-acetylmuramate dehydrogenase [Methylophilaceae bacterium]